MRFIEAFFLIFLSLGLSGPELVAQARPSQEAPQDTSRGEGRDSAGDDRDVSEAGGDGSPTSIDDPEPPTGDSVITQRYQEGATVRAFRLEAPLEIDGRLEEPL